MRSKQSGFTLIEIAIVLVIIGLLLGGVLKGQELITSARVRNIIAQQDGIKAAFYGFQDRFRALPGDYIGASAFANIPGLTDNTFGGDGNGLIQQPNVPKTNEGTLAWMHLSHAGFLTGNYAMATLMEAATPTNSPTNPYNATLLISHDGTYSDTSATTTTTTTTRLNLKTGNQIPVAILAEIDRKIDDGNAGSGVFRFSDFQGAGTKPTITNCFTASTGAWIATSPETNCGGASLF